MSSFTRDDDGFGLIEAIISMMLLAIIAVAIAPMLWDGIRYSSEQASVATATREVNSTVEMAREDMRAVSSTGACSAVVAVATGPRTVQNGAGRDITVSGTSTGDCTPGTSVTLVLTAMQDGRQLATATAIVFVPPAPVDVSP